MKKFLFLIFLLCIPLYLFPFGKNKVNYYHHNWSVLISPHYRLYLPSDKLFLSNEISTRAESIFAHHSKVFGYSPSNRIRVVIYPDQIAFQQNNIIPGWIGEGTGGVTEFVKGRVVLPYSARGYYFQHVFAHELTHVFQGVRWGKGRMSQNALREIQIPLWMIEGMAEYNSLGLDKQCETFIADGILSGTLPNLIELSDLRKLSPSQYYFVYKEGQFFYYFMESTFGIHMLRKINDAIMTEHQTDAVLSNVTGMNLSKLNNHFMDFVRRRYLPDINKLSNTDLAAQRLLPKPSFMNMSPLALDENRTIFISDRKLLPSLLLYNKKNKSLKQIIAGGFNENYLEFHFGERAHISVSTNGRTLCFVSRVGGKDRIHLFDLKTHKDHILKIPYEMIQSPDLSPDGNKILFSAMDKDHFDIFLMNLKDQKITRITDERAYDNQPRWINSNTIVFSSSRFYGVDSNQSDLIILSLSNRQVLTRINTGERDIYPSVSKDHSKIAFVSASVHPTLYVYNLKNQALYKQFVPIGGNYDPSFTPKGKLIFTDYHKGKYNLYSMTPSTNTLISNAVFPITTNIQPIAINTSTPLKVKPYFPEFSIDNLFGAITFNSDLGVATLGMIDLSDLMGNHRARLILDSSIQLTNFNLDHLNADLSYVYLKERLDIGFRIYHYSNYFYQLSTFQTFFNIEQPYTTTWAALLQLSYPFTTFDRLESKIGMLSFDFISSIDTTPSNYIIHTFKQDRPLIDISFVHDSTLNDITGPVNGSRYQISLSASLPLTTNSVSYIKAIADYRSYLYLLPGYSFAFRAVGGRMESSDTNATFHLGGFNSLRGYDLWAFSGNTLGLLNFEFRFPLILNWKIGFPFQIPMPTIWGAFFADLGTAFNAGQANYTPWIVENDVVKLKDWHCGVGAGIRVIILPGMKIIADWATPYDLTGINLSSPWKTTLQIGIDF